MGKTKKTADNEDFQPHEILRLNLNKYTNKIITKDGKVKKKIAKQFTPHECEICNKKFSEKYNLACHMKVHSDDCYACPLCPYVGRTKQYLHSHNQKVHLAPNKHKCGVCGKMFHFECQLKEHNMVHTGEKPHKCNVCGKAFRVTFSLNNHMLIHTNEKPFKCSFCTYACRDNSTLKKHENRHMGIVKSYPCKLCPKKFPEKAKLRYHISEVHLDYLDLDLRKHPCATCGKNFRSKHNLTKHIQSVHEKLFACTCPICGKRVSNSNNLSAHLRTHFQERPYACTHHNCNKRFKDKSTLKKHTVIHQPHLQHACKLCGAMFTRLHRLHAHMRTHEPRDKSVQCHYCDVTFYTKNYLIKHIKQKHSKNRKKYICDHCGLKTHNKPSIVMHLKYGHCLENDDLQCKICKTKYRVYEYLKSHYLKTHNIRYKPMKKRKKKKKKEIKPSVEIKVEPMEEVIEEACEEIHVIQMPKEEFLDEEDPNTENDQLTYSKHVLSEDLAESILNDSGDQPENNFDEFLYRQVFHRRCKEEAPESKQAGENETLAIVTEKVKEIMKKTKEIRETELTEQRKRRETKLLERKLKREAKAMRRKKRQEIFELERVRQMYNKRLKEAVMAEGNKKGPVQTIKYFHQKTSEKTNKTNLNNENQQNNPKNSLDNTNDNLLNSAKDFNVEQNYTETNNMSTEETQKNLVTINAPGNKNNELSDKRTELNETNDVPFNENNSVDDITLSHLNKIDDFSSLTAVIIMEDNDLDEMIDESSNKTDVNDSSSITNKILSESNDTNTPSANSTCNDHNNITGIENMIIDSINDNSMTEIVNDSIHETDKEENQQHLTNNINVYDSKNDKENSGNVQGVLETNEGEEHNPQKDSINDKAECEDSTNDNTKKDDSSNDKNKKDSNNDEEDDGTDNNNDDDSEYDPDSDDETLDKKRLRFKTHQCNICFKLYPTKEELVSHCQSHFDMCNSTTLAKCPACGHVASAGIGRHMRDKHGIHVRIPFHKIKHRADNADGSRYCYEVDSKGTMMEIIPSVKILNHNAAIDTDRRNRERRDKTVATTRLVKKGKEWIVEDVAVNITSYEELPEFTKQELSKLKVTGCYMDRLGQLSRLAKKRQVKMMFPCDSCQKICRNFSALKLHSRRHDPNKKPFAPKIYKYKNTKSTHKPAPAKKKPEINLENRLAKPKPIMNKHKCDEKLKEFYETNIRGADIEFWQFLKIFNKIDRENIQDFKDLEGRPEFGIHINEDRSLNEETTSETVQQTVSEHTDDQQPKTSSQNKPRGKITKTTSKTAKPHSGSNFKSKGKLSRKKSSYKRVIMISKKERLERERAKDNLRQKIDTQNV